MAPVAFAEAVPEAAPGAGEARKLEAPEAMGRLFFYRLEHVTGEALELVARRDDRVLVAWSSLSCRGSGPSRSMGEGQRAALARALGFVDGACDGRASGPGCLGFEDSKDLRGPHPPEDGAARERRHVYLIRGMPYECLWLGRGILQGERPGSTAGDGSGQASKLVWAEAYTSTSGPPDVGRLRSRGPRVVWR